MGKYLDADAPQKAIDLYLNELSHVERQRLQPDTLEKLTAKAGATAALLEDLLSQFQALGEGNEEHRILLYGLLRQLPIVSFEPINYSFIGRVVIPLENVVDLLINLDLYTSGKPVRKGESPGTVELLSVSELEAQQDPSKAAEKPAQAVIDIAGIGPTYSATLRERASIHTTDDLLEQGGTPSKRAALAAQTGISEKLLTRWVRRADLMRIDGVGEEYGELLECAGLESVAQLARGKPGQVYDKLRMANATRQVVERLPAAKEIQDWIEQAKTLVGD
jgi:predicted flap endonuclease-1-like 5' DNA nuclease